MLVDVGMTLQGGPGCLGQQSPAMQLQHLSGAKIIQFEDQWALFGQGKVPMLDTHQGKYPAIKPTGGYLRLVFC